MHRNLIEAFIAGEEWIKFIELAPPTMALPPAPRFTFGNYPAELATWYFSHAGLGQVGVFQLAGCEVTGEHMLARADVNFLCSELNIHPADVAAMEERRQAGGGKKVTHLAGRHALIGPGFGVYGHWLVDILPRIYLLEAAGFPLDSLRFLMPFDLPGYGVAWLNMIGISDDQLVRYDTKSDVLRVEELVVPTFIRSETRFSPIFRDAVSFIKSRVALAYGDFFAGAPTSSFFVSRALASQSRPLKNRPRIEQLALEAGFQIVHPEQLSLVEQMQLFAQAKQIVGEYGSNLHNSIFSQAGTVVCALRGAAPHPGFSQSGLGHILDQPTGYVFGETNPNDPAGAFSVPEQAFADCLRLVLSGDGRANAGTDNILDFPENQNPQDKNYNKMTATRRVYTSLAASLRADIPVLIPAFNNPTYVGGMVAQLLDRGLCNITIIDNASTMPEMRRYLDAVAELVKVVRLDQNLGPHHPWAHAPGFHRLPDLFCITDPDLQLNPNLPSDFLAELEAVTERFQVGKAGFSLDISEPDLMREQKVVMGEISYSICEWEQRFWNIEIGATNDGDPIYKAEIDTSFALYNKKYFRRELALDAVRVAGRYICRHLPWYKDNGLPPAEEEFYKASQKFSNYIK